MREWEIKSEMNTMSVNQEDEYTISQFSNP
jgi:hypothetical protein